MTIETGYRYASPKQGHIGGDEILALRIYTSGIYFDSRNGVWVGEVTVDYKKYYVKSSKHIKEVVSAVEVFRSNKGFSKRHGKNG